MQAIDPPPKILFNVRTALVCALGAASSASTGSLSLVIVVLAAHFLGLRSGRAAATGVTLASLWMALTHHATGTSWAPAGTSLVTVALAWLCAELTRARGEWAPRLRPPTQPGFEAPLLHHGVGESRDDGVYSKVVDCVPACVCVADPQGKLLYVNRAGLGSLGKALSEITGDKWQAFVHPDDMEEARAHWKRCLATCETINVQLRLRQHDKGYRWQHIVAEPFFDERGELINWYVIGVDVDDAAKAQEALQKSEREARELLDRLPGRFATRTEKDFDFVNRAILEETGTTLENLQNLGFLRFIHPDDRERMRQSFLRSQETKREHASTFRWAQADGTYRWNFSRAVPYFNEDGSVEKWYSMTLDIDELYRSKEIIREREMQLNWITDAVPSLLWRTDASGCIEYVNKRTEEYTGRSLNRLRDEGWYDLLHPDDALSVIAAWEASLNTGEHYDAVVRLCSADGSYRWHQCKGSATRNSDGQIMNWFGLSTDIHERKLAEAALKQREHQLLQITETMPCLLWCTDPDGQPTYINKRTADYGQVSVSEMRNFGYRSNIHPDDWQALNEAFLHSIRTGEPYQHVARVRRGDGVYRWHQLAAEAMRDANGNIVQWYGISVDIDEPKRAEDRLRQIQADLAYATRIATVAELSASIAHELNQPLTSIIANAQACARWLAASPSNLGEARASVAKLVADARSADETMRSIRALFKRQSLEKRGRIVKDLVIEAVRLLRASENKRAAEIEFDFPNVLPLVFVDQIQIQQVLINLISNGIEATENTGRSPNIRIAAKAKDDRVVIEVVDNGSGIAGTERIFDPFFTTKAKGMGIGLAVSRSIIEAHDGTLTGSNNVDVGATFSISLLAVCAASGSSLPL